MMVWAFCLFLVKKAAGEGEGEGEGGDGRDYGPEVHTTCTAQE